MIIKKLFLIFSISLLFSCGQTTMQETYLKKIEDERKSIKIDGMTFNVWPTSKKNFVRVARSETKLNEMFKTPKVTDLLDYQSRYLAEAARKVTGCDVDLEASSMTSRTCLFCTPQFYAKLQCVK